MGFAKKAAGVSTVDEDILAREAAFDIIGPVSDSTDEEPQAPIVWSDEQEAIFAFGVNEDANLVVIARAGTGKTTTIVELVKRYLQAHPDEPIVVCAYNKRIADELTYRFRDFDTVEVKTLHALGFSIVRNQWDRVRVAKPAFKRADYLTEQVCGKMVPFNILKLVTKLHSKGREIVPLASSAADLYPIAEQFECAPDNYWEIQGYGLAYVCQKAFEAMVLSESEEIAKKTGIDYADMVCLPVRMKWTFPQYARVVVDEAQDMSLAKLLLAQGVCAGKMIVVGDNRQAIYGFAGADSGSLARLKKELNAKELGLKTTYRCGKKIVQEANRYVPDFVAGESAHEGMVRSIPKEQLFKEVKASDFVLSRLNAPLVSIAMYLLRNNTRCRIVGKDIGDGLKTLVQQWAKGSNSVPEFLERLYNWEVKQVERARRLKWTDRLEQILDQSETMKHLAMNATSIRHIEERIDYLFSDDGEGDNTIVVLSTVHKAKGLEANRVFVLQSTLRPGKSAEEDNICYVAITRARSELIYVV